MARRGKVVDKDRGARELVARMSAAERKLRVTVGIHGDEGNIGGKHVGYSNGMQHRPQAQDQ